MGNVEFVRNCNYALWKHKISSRPIVSIDYNRLTGYFSINLDNGPRHTDDTPSDTSFTLTRTRSLI